MLTLVGDKTAVKDAKDILGLETELAKVQWTRVENRDPVKRYNKYEFAKLAAIAPGYDWKSYLIDSGVDGKTDYLVVSQPSYISGFNQLLQKRPLTVWKTYFRWRLLNDFAPYLSKNFVNEHFAFYDAALRGVPQNRPRRQGGRQDVSRSREARYALVDVHKMVSGNALKVLMPT
jgi:putative endopeptidase